MSYLLHIDTSAETGTVAVSRGGALIATVRNTEPRNHAASINLMVENAVAEAGITLSDLSAITVCAGPGSYTGLRIALATAKGLCYALDKPLLLDNKLTLLAFSAYQQYGGKFSTYVPLMKAREAEYFVSVFDSSFNNINEAAHILASALDILLKDLSGICFIFNNLDDEHHQKYSNNAYVAQMDNFSMEDWAKYAYEQYKCNRSVNLSTAEPFYLKQVYTHN